VPYITLVYNSA